MRAPSSWPVCLLAGALLATLLSLQIWPGAARLGLSRGRPDAPRATGLRDTTWRAADGADADAAEEARLMRPVGLRRIQRRPELIDALDDGQQQAETIGILERAAARLRAEAAAEQRQQQQQWAKRSAGARHEFIYVLAPFSEQALPFERAKVAQGYTRLVGLARPSYRTGLQRLTGDGGGAGGETGAPAIAAADSSDELLDACRTKRARVRLARDELDPATGQLVRQCAGLVELNTCEGQCASSVQPSIWAPGGLAKKCACCSERAFRRVQVRLDECQTAPGASATPARNYMDVEVEEPVECKCRACAAN